MLLIGTSLFSPLLIESDNQKDLNSSPSSPFLFSYSSAINIDNDSAFITYGFPGNGTFSNPFRIENLEIISNETYSIRIQNTNSFFIITNCKLNSTYNGINLKNLANNTAIVENNVFSNFDQGIGLYIENSSFTKIIDNHFSYSKTAIMTRLDTDNCTIINNSFEYISSECFSIQESDNCVIISNECLISSTFLYAYFCDYLTVVNNFCDDTRQFTHVSHSQNCNISSNTCSNITENGIYIGDTDSCDVLFNEINGGSAGLRIVSSSNVNICCNTIEYCNIGLGLRKSRECYIKKNNFTKCGISIDEVEEPDIDTWMLEDNLVNGKLLGFYRHKGTNFLIEEEYGQLILVDCFQVTVRNIKIENTSMGIGLFYCDYSIVENCTISNTVQNFVLYESYSCNITTSYSFASTYGLVVSRSENCYVLETEIYNNDYGIQISLSEYCYINKNNILANNHYGIELHFSDYCEITENTIKENIKGIYLNFVSTILIGSNYISQNYPNPVYNNNSAGIYSTAALWVSIKHNSFTDNEKGILLLFSHYFMISDNCFRNNNYGIVGKEILESEIKYNWFEENSFYAITLSSISTGNIIHHNAFINNNNGNVQVLDDGFNNTWYKVETEEGNYWSDYQKTGNYSIDGMANSYDLYPLMVNPLRKSYSSYYAFFSMIILIPVSVIALKKYRKRKE